MPFHLRSPTTQGLIAGRLVSSQTGAPIAGAQVSYSNEATGTSGTAKSDPQGAFFLPLLSPGQYHVRVTAAGFQSREVQELQLPVAARLELNFRLRPLSDVWESGQYRSVFLPGSQTIVTFYGPDVDSSRSGSFESTQGRRGALESTVSQVIDPEQIRDLPLAGRDVYTMLVTQPGVTADTGTARGLGLAINGQRPSSSNFMLDGVENNNYLVTGPLTPIAPEAIQEYRVSTNNFSAEYGRTAGFLANAVTRSGGNQFHGVGYFYLKNEALNANGFPGKPARAAAHSRQGKPDRIPNRRPHPQAVAVLLRRLRASAQPQPAGPARFPPPHHRVRQSPAGRPRQSPLASDHVAVPRPRHHRRRQPHRHRDHRSPSVRRPLARHRPPRLQSRRESPHGTRRRRAPRPSRFHLVPLQGFHLAPSTRTRSASPSATSARCAPA